MTNTNHWDAVLYILHERVSGEPGYKEAVDQWGYGTVQYRERLEAVARYACQNWQGELLEIGCWKGETTIVLAKVAREFGRRVIGVDPWQVGLQNCNGTEYAEFAERTKDYANGRAPLQR
jgi:SAM-dependent methyltransferase